VTKCELFGSTISGFTTQHSDIDINLVLEPFMPAGLVLEQVCTELRKAGLQTQAISNPFIRVPFLIVLRDNLKFDLIADN